MNDSIPHRPDFLSEPTIAVYLDYMNLRRSCKAILSIDLHHVQHSETFVQYLKNSLDSLGEVVFNRLYTDMSREEEDPGFSRAMQIFRDVVTPFDTKIRWRDKDDYADLYITRDTYKHLWDEKNADHFVYITGDANFMPIYEDILEAGKSVTTIAVYHSRHIESERYHAITLPPSLFHKLNFEQYFPLFVKVIYYGEKKMIEANWDVYTTGHLASFIRENKNGKFPVLTLHEINECLEKMEEEKMLKTFSTMNEKGKPTKGIMLNHSHPKVDGILQRTRERVHTSSHKENGIAYSPEKHDEEHQ